jgi:hypothetical protein
MYVLDNRGSKKNKKQKRSKKKYIDSCEAI